VHSHERAGGLSPARRWLLALALASAIGLGIPAAMFARLAASIESQFFYPDQTVYSLPAQFGLAHEDVWIPGPGGSSLHGWWLPAQGEARGTVLHLHGNAGNISTHLPLVAWVPGAGFNLLTIDYRGYGQTSGTPTLNGVVDDGLAALRWLRSTHPGEPIVVIGQSLGGATATRVVAAEPEGVRLLVLDCPFSSYRGIATDAVRGTWMAAVAPAALRALPGPEKDPVSAIRKLKVPLLVLHSSDDTVVPLAHGRALFAAAPEPKRMIEVSNTAHVDGFTRPAIRQQAIAAMLDALQAR
jgi:fermentation-respiration switch protein FrsA (DUF1100 family)